MLLGTPTFEQKKHVLKRTYWYRMTCLDDSKMKPQLEEGIEKVVWMEDEQVKIALLHSYGTISSVIKKYKKLIRTKEEPKDHME